MFNRNILAYLEKWKTKKGRKPLVLRGARQVGKTYAVRLFAEKNFADLFYINLEKNEDYELFKDIHSISDFEKTADIILKKKIIPGKTLIFIDEIQNTPNLIELLRFFYEDRPQLHVIAAGSLLEVKIEKQGLAMPVGRIEYAYIYPLTFFEFLEASGEKNILNFLKKLTIEDSISSAIHKRATKLFYDYALIGGMPEVVSRYIQKSSQQELNSLYSSLITAYMEDIFKYATLADAKYIRYALDQAPYFAGERITYEKFGGSLYRSREMSEAFEVLDKTMLVHQIVATNSRQLPIIGQKKRAKKLLYLDAGFVNFKNNIQSEYIGLKNLNDLYRGKIAEQIVGQNIIASMAHMEQSLFYWAKDKSQGSAEVDFCVPYQGKLVGIEVKSGHLARMKSLWSFAENVENSRLVRIYSGEMREDVVSIGSKKHKFLSLPFYLINRIFDFC